MTVRSRRRPVLTPVPAHRRDRRRLLGSRCSTSPNRPRGVSAVQSLSSTTWTCITSTVMCMALPPRRAWDLKGSTLTNNNSTRHMISPFRYLYFIGCPLPFFSSSGHGSYSSSSRLVLILPLRLHFRRCFLSLGGALCFPSSCTSSTCCPSCTTCSSSNRSSSH